MRVLRSGDAVSDDVFAGAYAIGNFDGVHLGHRALIDRAKEVARARGGPAGVLTFDPHPSKVLNPALAPRLILTTEEKSAALEAAGVEVLAVVRFDADVSSWPPDEFARRILVEWLRARCAIVGEGFRFGHKAKGTIADLAPHVATIEIPTQRIGGLVVSSTKIRELVLEGRVEAAALLLGRPYALTGPVVRGDARGRTIGVPTANIQVERELLPKLGVYAARAHLADGRTIDAVTNVGQRPTFQGQGVRVEAHLLSFDDDLYGHAITLDLVRMLREEQRFANIDELKAQIARDIDAARAVLA